MGLFGLMRKYFVRPEYAGLKDIRPFLYQQKRTKKNDPKTPPE
jgi:hypothetical protein